MTLKKRRGYCDDLKKAHILRNSIIITIVMGLILLAFIWADWTHDNSEAKKNATYNEFASEFNNLSDEDRALIQRYMAQENQDKLDENLMLPLEEDETISFWEKLVRQQDWLRATLLLFYSSIVTISYSIVRRREKEYLWTDIPISKPYGLFLLISMFIAWPILLIRKGFEAYARRKKLEMCAEELLRIDYAESNRPQASEQDYRNLIERLLLPENSIAKAEKEIEDCNKRLNEIQAAKATGSIPEESLDELMKEIEELQGRKNLYLASIRRQKRAASSSIQRHDFHSEWEAIRNSRGVIGIRIDNDCLYVVVRVRYLLDGKEYDFGDYELRLKPNFYECASIRSSTDDALYQQSDHEFCFGNRACAIDHYVANRQYAEAIILAIDSMHGVNEGCESEVPYHYIEVKEIEKAKARLLKKRSEK